MNEYSHDFFAYQLGWDVQQNQAYCALATVAAVLNSWRVTEEGNDEPEDLMELPIDALYDPFPYATQHDIVAGSPERGSEFLFGINYSSSPLRDAQGPEASSANRSHRGSNPPLPNITSLRRHHKNETESDIVDPQASSPESNVSHTHNSERGRHHPASTSATSDRISNHSRHDVATIDQRHSEHRGLHKYSSSYNCVNDRVLRYNSTLNGILASPGGLSLIQTGELLKCHLPAQWNVTVTYVDPMETNADQVRTALLAALLDADSRVFVNVDRHVLGQSDHAGAGHFSPLASYSKPHDAFLILDVAKYRFPSSWISAARLHAAMATVDSCGNWDFPHAQDRLSPAQLRPLSPKDMEEAYSILNCRPTFRGFVVVKRL
jgi:hypothetical protein